MRDIHTHAHLHSCIAFTSMHFSIHAWHSPSIHPCIRTNTDLTRHPSRPGCNSSFPVWTPSNGDPADGTSAGRWVCTWNGGLERMEIRPRFSAQEEARRRGTRSSALEEESTGSLDLRGPSERQKEKVSRPGKQRNEGWNGRSRSTSRRSGNPEIGIRGGVLGWVPCPWTRHRPSEVAILPLVRGTWILKFTKECSTKNYNNDNNDNNNKQK